MTIPENIFINGNLINPQSFHKLKSAEQMPFEPKFAEVEGLIFHIVKNEEVPEVVEKQLEHIDETVLENVINANTVQRSTAEYENANRFEDVFSYIDERKLDFGADEKDERPVVNHAHNGKSLFGVPWSAVQDFFYNKVNSDSKVKGFWKLLAKITGVNTKRTQYIQISTEAQRFGLLIANKGALVPILEQYKKATLNPTSSAERINDLAQVIKFTIHDITGYTSHPLLNFGSLYLDNLDVIESFITEHFESARTSGDDARIKAYFEAFRGLCFESHVRNILRYIETYPLSISTEELESIDNAYDNERTPVQLLGDLHAKHPDCSYSELLKAYYESGLKDFNALTGPVNLEAFQNYAVNACLGYILDPPESDEDIQMYLEAERDIYKENNDRQSASLEDLNRQVIDRIKTCAGEAWEEFYHGDFIKVRDSLNSLKPL